MSKRKYPKEFRRLAVKGDRLVHKFARKLRQRANKHGIDFKGQGHFLEANECLSVFDPQWKRHVWHSNPEGYPNKYPQSKKGQEKKGDRVEARIAWLEENYGEEAAFRYYLKGLSKYADKLLSS